MRKKLGGDKKKMKTKILALIGIAVCVLLLLTSPALASAGYSKIYGNANEDDTLDMRDVTYLKLVIFGKKPETKLADANYDGKISMLDIGQTKLIILGKEKRLTLVDQADRTVTVPRPIERVVTHSVEGTRTVVELGAADKLVAISGSIKRYELEEIKYFSALRRAAPELKELPNAGDFNSPALELIVSLKPDVVFASSSVADIIQANTGIPTVAEMDTGGSLDFELYRLVGKVIGKEKEAEELISYANEKKNEITEVTSEIPEDEKPKVFRTSRPSKGITSASISYEPLELAGGINVASDCLGYSVEVSKEQIIAWNPDIILLASHSKPHVATIEDVLSDSDLQTISAVKNQKVYYTDGGLVGYDHATLLTSTFYMAKLFHPEKFEDLDAEKECNEILDRFYGVDGLWLEVIEKCDLYTWK